MKISIGTSRRDINWKVQDIAWEDLCEKLKETERTKETVNEYKKASKDVKQAIKDVGGFVGGVVVDGRRKKGSIACRTLVTLDADYAEEGLIDSLVSLKLFKACVYSTHSHLPKAPRYRIIIPIDREVTCDEYEPIARKVAQKIGIEQFDTTTYEASRLMFWPSTPRDGAYVFEMIDGPILCADSILDEYEDWRDTVSWPLADREEAVMDRQIKAQGDPLEKAGLVGLFNQAYTIPEAIDAFIPDDYESCGEGRYTYMKGSTYAGAVMYENGLFLYSHHETDPSGGKLCNAFDLIRLHKYSALDLEAKPETPLKSLPSNQAMLKFASMDEKVKGLIVEKSMESAKEDFRELYEPGVSGENWASKLSLHPKTGEILPTIGNCVTILNWDPNIAGRIKINEFLSRLVIREDMPWRKCQDKINGDNWTDSDDSALRYYIEETYGINNRANISDAVLTVAATKTFHPIREFLEELEWDGKKRIETLLIKYLGAEDNAYTRTVTKTWLVAAVARVMQPGIKFDNMLVLVGDQGIGKSYLIRRLSLDWFSDTLVSVQGKESFESLQGVWIMEIGELSALKKAESEAIKLFISKQEDIFRAAYHRHIKVNRRQCVFCGTTNEHMFLRDPTGNRRFWPVMLEPTEKERKALFNLTDDMIMQFWAEAKHYYEENFPLHLPSEIEEMASQVQEQFREDSPKLGQLKEYLDMPLPENWEKWNKEKRRDYVQGYLPESELNSLKLTKKRDIVCISEIAYELFNDYPLNTYDAREYHNLMRQIPGWKKSTRKSRIMDYGRQPVYQRTEEEEDGNDKV